MDNKRLVKEEKENDQKGILLSVSLHILVLLAAYFMPAPPPIRDNSDTIIVVELPKDLGSTPALGLPNEGSGNDRPSAGKPDPNAGSSAPEKKETPKPTPTPPPPVKPVIARPTPTKTERPVVTTEDPNVVAVRKQQAEAKRKADELQAQQEYERRRQAEAAAAKAADDKRKYDEAKSKFGDKFGKNTGGGDGTGRGNTGKPGNQGRPDGDPNSDNLTGAGSGPGNISGFGNRKPTRVPKCEDNSSETGVVVVEAQIDPSGNVISAKFKAVGSTNNSQAAISFAINCARQYKFQAGSGERVTGLIKINLINR